jgi:hypothetical protein
MTLNHIVTTTLGYIVAAMTMDITVAFDTTVVFVILLVAMLTS